MADPGIPVYESALVNKWGAMLASDFGGGAMLVVGDLLLYRTRMAVHDAIKTMFDAERRRLGLPTDFVADGVS